MMTISTTLAALQQAAASILAADDFFSGAASANAVPVPIISEKKGDILSQIQTCLGQVGVAALILTPTFQFHETRNNEIPDLNGWAYLTVTLYEDTTVNQGVTGTGIFAIALAERVLCVLHCAPHGILTGAVGGNEASTCFLGISKPIEMISEGPPLQYNVSFQAHVQLNPQYN
jgi:hypothetical protein